MIYKTLHRKLKLEQHEPNQKPGVNSGTLRMSKQFLLHMHLLSDSLIYSTCILNKHRTNNYIYVQCKHCACE
jgi:hypothetical protein